MLQQTIFLVTCFAEKPFLYPSDSNHFIEILTVEGLLMNIRSYFLTIVAKTICRNFLCISIALPEYFPVILCVTGIPREWTVPVYFVGDVHVVSRFLWTNSGLEQRFMVLVEFVWEPMRMERI